MIVLAKKKMVIKTNNCVFEFDENSDTSVEDFYVDRLLEVLNEKYPEANFVRKTKDKEEG